MKILPKQTQLPTTPTERRHQPTFIKTYQLHKECLRWDFGFSCAYCLLHEADVSGGLGAEGKGLMWIEHQVTQSADSSLAGDYQNCLYSCKFCNRARSAKKAFLDEKRLLDPTVDSWADHFEFRERFSLELVDDASPNAVYTYDSYDLGDLRKVALREFRERVISKCLERLASGPAHAEKFLELARQHEGEDQEFFLEYVRRITEEMSDARRTLAGYAGEPSDSSNTCRCKTESHHNLPGFLLEQILAI